MPDGISAAVDCFRAGAHSAHLDAREPVIVFFFISEKRASRSSGEHPVAITDGDYYARSGLSAFIDFLGLLSSAFALAERYLSSGIALRKASLISDFDPPWMRRSDLQLRLIADGYRAPDIFVSACCGE